MTVRIVLGAQFGDEAKGKISDFLSRHARYVVRSGAGRTPVTRSISPKGTWSSTSSRAASSGTA